MNYFLTFTTSIDPGSFVVLHSKKFPLFHHSLKQKLKKYYVMICTNNELHFWKNKNIEKYYLSCYRGICRKNVLIYTYIHKDWFKILV